MKHAPSVKGYFVLSPGKAFTEVSRIDAVWVDHVTRALPDEHMLMADQAMKMCTKEVSKLQALVPFVLRGVVAVPTLELIGQSGAIALRARGGVQKRDEDASGEQVEQEGSESEDDSVSIK